VNDSVIESQLRVCLRCTNISTHNPRLNRGSASLTHCIWLIFAYIYLLSLFPVVLMLYIVVHGCKLSHYKWKSALHCFLTIYKESCMAWMTGQVLRSSHKLTSTRMVSRFMLELWQLAYFRWPWRHVCIRKYILGIIQMAVRMRGST